MSQEDPRDQIPTSQDDTPLDEPRTAPSATEAGAPVEGSAPPESAVADPEQRLRDDLRAEVAGEPDEAAELRERAAQLARDLAQERERASDYMKRWQQAQADLANARRRAQQEQEHLLALAAQQSAALVLPALDSLERAFTTLPESLRRLTWVEGISLVEFQLRRVLEAQGVTPFEPAPGDALDPTRHQAIAEGESTEHPAGCVLDVAQRGYEMQGRVLRPALVRVARPPAAPPVAEAPGAPATAATGEAGEANASGP